MLYIKDKKYVKLIEYIRDSIRGTMWENHVYIVGGAVRDSLINGEVKDIDIAIDLRSGGLSFANWMSYKSGCFEINKNPVLFPAYGTAKFKIKGNKDFGDVEIECAQTRKEEYNNGSRNPVVTFGSLEDDSKRRDLTINAIYYNISKDEICDITGMGINDIKNKIIRTPGEPDKVFSDDPLRILRTIRFSSKFNWGIEKSTWIGMVKNSHKIKTISQERITEEINKILLTDKPSVGIMKMSMCNRLLEYVLPQIDVMKHIYNNVSPKVTLLKHTLDVVDGTKCELINRLGALFHDVGKTETYENSFLHHAIEGVDITEKVLRDMRYPNATINKVSTIVKFHESFSQYGNKESPSNAVLRKIRVMCGDTLYQLLDVINSNNVNQVFGRKAAQIPRILKRYKEIDAKEARIEANKSLKLPINGNDIMKQFNIKRGPIVGKFMNKVKDAYFANPKITKAECINIIREEINKTV